MSDEIDNLETKVTIDASEALKALNDLLKSTADYSDKVGAVSALIQGLADATGKSYERIATFLRQSSAVAGTSNKVITDGLKNIQTEGKKAGEDVEKAGKQSAAASNEAAKGATGWESALKGVGNALQTALGLSVYQVINNVIKGFQELISIGIEYEKILFRLRAASELWAKQGTPFSTDEMKKLAGDITTAFPVFSNKQAVEGVANISILARNLGLTTEETNKFYKAISAVSVLMGKDLSESAREAGLAISSGYSESLQKMGFNINKVEIANRALQLGFERTNGDFTQEAKSAATLSLILEQANSVYAVALEYQDTTPGKVDKATASWNNLVVSISEKLSPAIGNVAEGLDKLFVAMGNVLDKASKFTGWTEFIPEAVKRFFSLNDIITTLLETFVLFGAGVEVVMIAINYAIKGNLDKSIDTLKNFSTIYKQAFDQIRNDVLPDKKVAPPSGLDGSGAPAGGTIVDTKKLQSLQESLLKDMQAFGDRADKITRDFYEKEARLQEEYTQKVTRENQDYEIARANIIKDANTKIADAQRNHRQQELDDEAKFQLALKELRDKYLFDLEGALRNRDAGQVLRLMEQYKMNKDHLIEEHNLEKKQREENFRDEIAQLKSQEADRLALLAQEHALKLQRMQEDYLQQKAINEQENQDQMNDLKLQAQRRLEEYSRDVAKELQLRDGGAKAIYDLLSRYYGPDGLFDSLYDYSYNSLVAKTAALAQQMAQIYSQYAATSAALGGSAPATPSVPLPRGGGHKPGTAISMANGGTIVASKPTAVLMGDNGLEVGTFRPLNTAKVSSSNIPSFGEGVNAGGGGSKIELMLWLSPDLEARVVKQSLDSVANVVATVKRNNKQ